MIAATRFGSPLPGGGTIGVAAAASPYDSRSDVLRGVEWWEARGYRVKLGPGVWDRDDYVAGDPRRRADDLNALFADLEVDVVQALQGGFGSAHTIPYLDFDLIAANPKPLVGFSDITALHIAIPPRSGVATIYGNRLMGVGATETTPFTKQRLLDVLRTGGAGEVPRDPDDPWVRTIHGGRATAPLVGGCLWVLMQTMGTPWEIELEGAILFFEDTHTPPFYLDGNLVQLTHAGKLEEVAGVVVGQMEKSPIFARSPTGRAPGRSRTSSRSASSRSASRWSMASRSGTRSTWPRFPSASPARSTPTRRRLRSTSPLFGRRSRRSLFVVHEERADGTQQLRANGRAGRAGRL